MLKGAVQPHLEAIQSLDPQAVVGFRGSLARGFKGPHKANAPFDPKDFDVDAFIISDHLATRVPARGSNFRSAREVKELVGPQNEIGRTLKHELPGLRPGRFTFRVYNRSEFEKKVGLDERFFIGAKDQ
jgi:hypothetical protein